MVLWKLLRCILCYLNSVFEIGFVYILPCSNLAGHPWVFTGKIGDSFPQGMVIENDYHLVGKWIPSLRMSIFVIS